MGMKSPSGVWGGSPIVTYHAQHPKNGSQGAKRSLTLTKPVLPAFAKSPPLYCREAEMGFGDEIPKQGLGRQPHRTPMRSIQKTGVRERSVP